MTENEADVSQITQFFSGSTVFLTGASGYLGGMFMEKLIRVCDDINKIYVLLRPKKGKKSNDRFDELFDGPNYEPLKKLKPNYREKVELVSGDLLEEDLGISNDDRRKLIEEVDCVIHCGATVRFDEHLRKAAYTNVRSVMYLINMAKEMKKLRVFLYISTAFSSCTVPVIKEKVFDPPMSAKNLLQLLDTLDDDTISSITPILIGEYPNTYTYTKIIAENVVKNEGKGFPIAIHRPSVVVASLAEPVPGWINNMYGFTGVMLGGGIGVIRVFPGRQSSVADLIPADVVINSAIAAMWDVATQKSLKNTEENANDDSDGVQDNLVVYNCVSSVESPVTYQQTQEILLKMRYDYATPKIIWHYVFFMIESEAAYKIVQFLLHMVPAYIVDLLARCIGKEPVMVNHYKKINKFIDVLTFFSVHPWKFENDNTQQLWNKLGKVDRELYPFSMKHFDWTNYYEKNLMGARLYILKDPLDTIPQGRIVYRNYRIAHYALVTFLCFLLYKFLICIYNFVLT